MRLIPEHQAALLTLDVGQDTKREDGFTAAREGALSCGHLGGNDGGGQSHVVSPGSDNVARMSVADGLLAQTMYSSISDGPYL